MVDRYTKLVLTVIAAALSVIAFRGFTPPANAGALAYAPAPQCGTISTPCYVEIANTHPVEVTVKRDILDR